MELVRWVDHSGVGRCRPWVCFVAEVWIRVDRRGFDGWSREWWAGCGVSIERWRGVLWRLVPLGLYGQEAGQADDFSAGLIELVVVVAQRAQRACFGNIRRFYGQP